MTLDLPGQATVQENIIGAGHQICDLVAAKSFGLREHRRVMLTSMVT